MLEQVLGTWAVRKGLDALFARVKTWFKATTPRKVLIIGPGGVGKTTLAQLFSLPPDKTSAPNGQYTESISVETSTLGNAPKVQVVVLPGQAHRIDATWKTILDELKDGRFRGVIFLLAYGHHALGDISYMNHRLYNKRKGLDDFVAKYLAECRNEEMRILKLLCNEIRQCKQPVWFMTLVTKQDLWWDERDTVKSYYESDEYLKNINECLGSKATNQFRHESVFVSLVLRNLMTGRNELLKSTVSGYDQPLQLQSFERLLQVFDGLMEWEKQHADK